MQIGLPERQRTFFIRELARNPAPLERFRTIAGYDHAKRQTLYEYKVHKIGRADIIAALADLAEHRPRRIIEVMSGRIDEDLADIFFQTVLFGDYCYYH